MDTVQVIIEASPNSVTANTPLTLSWTSTGTGGLAPCAPTGGTTRWQQQTSFPPQGSFELTAPPDPGTYTFGLTCFAGDGTTGSAEVDVVVVAAAAEVVLSADSERVSPGGSIALEWLTDGLDGAVCTALGGDGTSWGANESLDGNGRLVLQAPPLGASGEAYTIEFRLRCSAGGVTVEGSVVVTVGPSGPPPVPPFPGLGSTTTSEFGAGASSAGALSGDGQTLAFVFDPTTSAKGVSGGQILLRRGSQLDMVSVDDNGTPLTVPASEPELSADGSKLVFSTDPGAGSPGAIRLYSGLGRTQNVSTSGTGQAANGISRRPTLSADGQWLVFESTANNLVAGVSGQSIYAKNLDTQAIAEVGSGVTGDGLVLVNKRNPRVSADGSSVVFVATVSGINQICLAGNPLIAGARPTTCVSRNAQSGLLGNQPSDQPDISADGRFVVFQSQANNLVGNDSNGVSDVFWAEIGPSGEIIGLLAASTSQGRAGNGASTRPRISDDGEIVLFESMANNLAAGDFNDRSDTFIRYVRSGQISRYASTPSGAEPNGDASQAVISGDGRRVAFTSSSSNLVAGDGNGQSDVFTGINPLISNADEPGLVAVTLPAPVPANANCPAGYFTTTITDGPGTGIQNGSYGLELLLDVPGTRVLSGGLNFGGLVDVGQVGFAGANIANATGENQRLNISLTGNPITDINGTLPVRVTINRRTATSSETVFDNSVSITNAQAFETSIVVSPGYYEALVAPEGFDASQAGGPAEGQFFFSLTTSFVDRPGGGFQGGAVVGGYHAENPFGGVSGFAAFCIATPHTTSIRVLSAPSYGPAGAGDLRLEVLDVNRQSVYRVP